MDDHEIQDIGLFGSLVNVQEREGKTKPKVQVRADKTKAKVQERKDKNKRKPKVQGRKDKKKRNGASLSCVPRLL